MVQRCTTISHQREGTRDGKANKASARADPSLGTGTKRRGAQRNEAEILTTSSKTEQNPRPEHFMFCLLCFSLWVSSQLWRPGTSPGSLVESLGNRQAQSKPDFFSLVLLSTYPVTSSLTFGHRSRSPYPSLVGHHLDGGREQQVVCF